MNLDSNNTLKVEVKEDALRLSLSILGEGAMRSKDVTVDWDVVRNISVDCISTLEQSRWRDGGGEADQQRIERCGHELAAILLPDTILHGLEQLKHGHLSLALNEQSGRIPWELIGLNQGCLCTEFAMSRVFHNDGVGTASLPLVGDDAIGRIQLIVNPRFDLPASTMEAGEIRRLGTRRETKVEVDVLEHSVTHSDVADRMSRTQWLHYAGHASSNLGDNQAGSWELSDNSFGCEDILAMDAVPKCVINNACATEGSSSTSELGGISQPAGAMAEAFIRNGTRHYVGTITSILDRDALEFGKSFYKELFAGKSIARSMHMARIALRSTNSLAWAAYQLIGEPEYIPMPIKNEFEYDFPATCASCNEPIKTRHGVGRWDESAETAKPVCRNCVRSESKDQKPPVNWALDRNRNRPKI